MLPKKANGLNKLLGQILIILGMLWYGITTAVAVIGLMVAWVWVLVQLATDGWIVYTVLWIMPGAFLFIAVGSGVSLLFRIPGLGLVALGKAMSGDE